jgi:molecular chaperone Hsp33
MLKSVAPKDRAEMVKDHKVVVTCEFCSSVYQFTPHEAGVEEWATLKFAGISLVGQIT